MLRMGCDGCNGGGSWGAMGRGEVRWGGMERGTPRRVSTAASPHRRPHLNRGRGWAGWKRGKEGGREGDDTTADLPEMPSSPLTARLLQQGLVSR